MIFTSRFDEWAINVTISLFTAENDLLIEIINFENDDQTDKPFPSRFPLFNIPTTFSLEKTWFFFYFSQIPFYESFKGDEQCKNK